MAVYLDDFYNANDRNLNFSCKIDIFSEAISSGRTYFAIWGIKHFLALSVESIQDHGFINQFSNMMGYLGEFFQDLCGIHIESY